MKISVQNQFLRMLLLRALILAIWTLSETVVQFVSPVVLLSLHLCEGSLRSKHKLRICHWQM